jgi:hypothetical protein
MKTMQLDVDLVVQREMVLAKGGFERLMPDLMGQMRYTANERANEAGGEVRSTVQPDFVMNEMQSPLLGDVFVMATRWTVDLPDNAEISIER